MEDLIKPKEIEITDIDGHKIQFRISRLKALAGREVIAKYPLSSIPKIGSYESNKEIMFKLVSHSEVLKSDKSYRLNTHAMIDNHVPDGQTLLKLEYELLRYNVDFLQPGKWSGFLESMKGKLLGIVQKILTQSLGQSLKRD